mgnify:FL=1
MSQTPSLSPDPAAIEALGIAVPRAPAEAALFVRYLRALALLCECRPCLDEPDYADLIDRVLDDAAAHYPLDIERDGARRGVMPRGARSG